MFHYLMYMSTAKAPMESGDLYELLEVCRRNNAAVGVTGALLHHKGTFLQVLEGDASIVSAVYDKLCRDPRHGDITKLISGNTETRQFADWSMAFRDLDGTDRPSQDLNPFMLARGHGTYGDTPTAEQRTLRSVRASILTRQQYRSVPEQGRSRTPRPTSGRNPARRVRATAGGSRTRAANNGRI